jgi:glycosidase
VLQTGAPVYSWNTTNYVRPDKRTLVVYELLVRDFVANHDWKTLKDSLSYFRSLGINAIEVMPFNEFEGNNSWGYNPDFYFAPDKYYGPENTLKEFIDSCHRSGIAVIMDVALNHSFGSSPMVQLYFDNQNNRPAADNPWFNPVPKHAFNVGYDMNHESPDTKYFVSRVMEHWTQQYKIDGFRFDLSKGFTQKQTCDANGNNCDVAAMGAYDSSRVTIWKGYYDSLQSKSAGTYAILEHFADNSEEKVLSDYGMMLWGNMNTNYAQASLGYQGPDPGGNQPDFTWGIYTSRGWTKPYLVTYMESHDEERIMYKNEQYGNSSGSYNIKDTATGLKRIELDGAFFFTIPGPKMMWEFEELGYDYSINWCTNGTIDPTCRLTPKPIRWDYLKDPRRKEVHDVFSSLIKLRFHPLYKDVFLTGSINSSLSATFKWIKVSSASDTSDILVVGNFDVQAQTSSVSFQTAGTWFDYLAGTPYTATGSAQNITLQPGEFHIYVNRNVSNANATAVTEIPWSGNTLEAIVYPNPMRTAAILEVKMPARGKCTAGLYNATGQYVATVYNNFLEKGINKLSLKNVHEPSGSYYLKVSTKTGNKTVHLIIH